MRNRLGLMFAALLMASGTLIGRAQAAPISTADGIRTAADTLKLVERAQYVWNGRNYCWYDSGWKGPGWYVCSYGPWVSGLWWGGGFGWHNWHWHGHRGHHVEHHGGGKHKGGHHVSHHKGGGRHVSHHAGGGRHVSHHRGGGGGHHMRRGGGGHHVSHRGGHRGGGGGGRHRSDLRLKEDVVPLVRLDNGLELYRFRYNVRDRTASVGVMAQEVWTLEPSAVWRARDGYLMVDYDRIGLKFLTWREWQQRAKPN